MKSKMLSIILLIAFHPVFGQPKPKITLGKPYGVIDAEEKYYFAKDNEILTVKIDKRVVTLQKLDASNLTFKTIKVYDKFKKDTRFEKVTQFKNKYYLFYSLEDADHEQLFAQEIDFATGSFSGKPNRIVFSNEKFSDAIASEFETGNFFTLATIVRVAGEDKFDFYFSNDSSRMIVQYRLRPEKKSDSKSHDVIGINVFNESLSTIWENRVTMPYTEKKMNNLDYTVDKNGNVFIVTSVFDDNTTDTKKTGKEEPNYHLEILKVEAKTAAITKTIVDVADKFIKTLWLYESAKGYMIAAGFYNKGKKSENADGVIMFKISQDGKMFDLNTHEIPLELLNQYASKKEKRKNARNEGEDKAEFESLKLRDIIPQKDGSIVLIGEQSYSVTSTHHMTTGGGAPGSPMRSSSTTTTTYYKNDILITKINESGKLDWMKKLPKQQSGYSPIGGMSYRWIRGKNEHYLVFLDDVTDMNLPPTEKPETYRDGSRGFFTAYKVIDATGDVSKISILDTRDVQGTEIYQCQPRRMVNTAANTLVFEAYKKKKEDVLVKVEFEK